MKNILIISQYSSYPDNGLPGRAYYLSKYLSKDNNICLCLGSFHHRLNTTKHQQSSISYMSRLRVISLKLFRYTSSRSYLRIVNWFIFTIKLIFLSKNKIGFTPNYIIYSSPSLMAYLGAYILSIRFKCKIYIEIRDIWPLSLSELGNISNKNILYIFLQKIEDFAYRNSNGVISNLSNLTEHIKNRIHISKIKFHFLPNGIEIADSEKNIKKLSEDEGYNFFKKIDLIKSNEKKIICYCGGLAVANAMNIFIDSAKLYNKNNLVWMIVGEGPEKENLYTRCQKENIDNVVFYDHIDKKYMSLLYSKIDILFLANNFLKLYEYGLSPIKLPEYMYSGKPIIHVTNSKSLLEETNTWEVIKSYDPHEVINAINRILELSHELKKKNALKTIEYAHNNLQNKHIFSSLINFLAE